MNTQKFKENGNNKFPVSTDTFDFMQEQILLASKLSALAGGYVIIKQSTASSDGLCIYNGELMPLKKSPDAHIVLRTVTESITANGETFRNVRTIKYAEYVAAGGRPATSFWSLTNLQTLKSQLDAAAQHHVPTGAIMMWSGSIANIPTGWALCDGQNGTPNLQGRFIVGATTGIVNFDGLGYNYPVGTTGGNNQVRLTAAQSGVPAHSHTMDEAGSHSHDITYYNNGDGNNDTEYTNEWAVDGKTNAHPVSGGGSGTKVKAVRIDASYGDTWIGNHYIQIKNAGAHDHEINENTAKQASQYHENRPVFYALAYIMKVI